jgi:ubiquinone/menaquinone biosynthesis C-methylase UbiE
MDNRSYYDDFSHWYERERGRGYHQMLDDLELEVVERYGAGKRVLEAGCGTGLLLEHVAGFASHACGIDLSDGMLAKARERGLDVRQGSITELPYADASFDVVYSVKVLSHIEDIETAMAEMARVTVPGGYVLAEFYNPRSIRGLIKALKPATAISERTNDEAVYTRYDDSNAVRSYLPPSLEWVATRGVRIVTPAAFAHKVPGLAQVLRFAEHKLADAPGFRNLGGFMIAILRKR